MTDAGPIETTDPELAAATVRGLRWTALTRPAIEVLLLGSMVVLARMISPAEFGRYAIAIIVLELSFISNEGVGSALVQRATVTRKHLQAGFGMSLVLGVTLACLTLLAAATIVPAIFGERTAELVRLATPMTFVAAVATVPMATLRRRLAFRLISLIDVLNAVLRAGVSITLAIVGLNGEALVLGALAAGFAAMLVSWVNAPAPLPWLHRQETRELLDYGGPASIAAISWIGFRNCDYAIVAARLGAFQAGLYFRAYTLGVEYQRKVSVVLTLVGFPVMARARGSDARTELHAGMVRLLTQLLFPMLALLAVLAPVLVPWLFGSAWAGAVVPTQILAAGGAATLVIDAAGAALMAAGRPRALLAYGWAHFGVYAAAVLLVAPLGLTKVAIAATAIHTLFVAVAYLVLLPGHPLAAIRRMWADTQAAVVSCAALVAAAMAVRAGLENAGAAVLVLLTVTTIAGTAAYLLTLRFVFPDAWRGISRVLIRVIPLERLRRRGKPALTPADARAGR